METRWLSEVVERNPCGRITGTGHSDDAAELAKASRISNAGTRVPRIHFTGAQRRAATERGRYAAADRPIANPRLGRASSTNWRPFPRFAADLFVLGRL